LLVAENFLGRRVLSGSYCQINAASESPDCRTSSAARALAMVASIMPNSVSSPLNHLARFTAGSSATGATTAPTFITESSSSSRPLVA
jgi:hypothetical protein